MCCSPQKVCWILAIMGKGEMIYDIGGGEGERHRHKDITLYKEKNIAGFGSVLWYKSA